MAAAQRQSGYVRGYRAVTAASLLVLATGFSTASLAADAAGAPPPGDIVVTAQRREQKLQDVGIAITALPGTAMKQLNVNNANDLSRVVPSLKMNAYSSAEVVFNIRGVSQNDYGDQQEPPIAVYQDDSYSSSINMASFPTFDLARVEVLRGPQGTLFGRNATGGAVQFISNQPTKTLGGYGTVTVGRYGSIITEGALSGPLTDDLQVRIAGIRERDHGYIKNINPGYKPLGANNHYALRGIIAWQPTDAIKTTLTLRYLRAPKERQAGMYSFVTACPNAQFQGEVLGPNESCAFWGSGPGEAGDGYRNDAIDPTRGGNRYRTAATDPTFVDRRNYGATFKAEAALTDRLSLTSITDYQHGKKFYNEDADVSPAEGVYFSQGSKMDQASEELRLAANLGTNQLTAGAFGMLINGHYFGSYTDPFYGYLPSAIFSQRTRSFAFFAQDEWALNDKIKLIGGLRYWHDKKRGSYFAEEHSYSDITVTFNPREVSYTENGVTDPLAGITSTPADAKPSFHGLTARAEIDFKPVDHVLLYASYNRGSKSGGFTFGTGTPFPGTEVATLNGIPYKPETLDDYEVGAKTTLAPGTTLNLAAFYYHYHNYQAFAEYGTVQTVVNKQARSKGIEADFATRPLRGLTLQLSAAFLDTDVKHITLPDLVTVVNHDLPQAPGFSGNALVRYEFALAGGTASVQVDAQHSGKFCFSVLCAPVEREPAYNIVNGRVGFAGPDDRWEVAAFVTNMFSEVYRTYGYDSSEFDGTSSGVFARPRSWGLTGTMRFGS